MRKDFSHLPGEHIITWLLRCWDNRASSLELEGREAKQLGSLSREGGIDKEIGKKAQAFSLWRRLLSSMRKRCPFSEDVVCWPGKWTTMERGILYLRKIALGPVRAGPDVQNVLYTTAGENGPTWSLWQKAPGETRGQPLGFWSQGYRGSEARYTPTEKEILAAYEGVRAASEVIGTEAQLLLAPRLPVQGWMFKERVSSTHHATDATWSEWVALITQWARIGNPNRPGILEVITDWPEGKDFGMSPEEEVTRAEEAPLYNKLTEDEKPYALFTDGSCRIVGKHRR
ncbi:hypothetical protein GRJ2_001726300 [Grus japonensis]|uniref:Reverse transcriptase/retrotransposon-derived protein RNase H-like domain-containing protein n=1 Tax=Grus japonensis TaxID=30415 RepID=A0ABC9X4J9_GRUJA